MDIKSMLSILCSMPVGSEQDPEIKSLLKSEATTHNISELVELIKDQLKEAEKNRNR